MSKKTSKKNRPNSPRILVIGGGIDAQLHAAGGEQVYMSNWDEKIPETVAHENIHGVVLTGGSDVNPQLHSDKRHKQTQTPNNTRDRVEAKALLAALKRGIPVLGICRGAQMINVSYGGSLHQHITDLPNTHKFHLGHDHRVDVKKDSRLRGLLQVDETWVVSIHHQAVDRVAKGFRIAARSRDGIIEAIETTPGPNVPWIVGVQFHPEIGTNPTTQRIFDGLVDEAARVAGMTKPQRRSPKKVQYNYPSVSKPLPKHWGDRPGLQLPGTQVGALSNQTVTWECFRCQIEFDEKADHVDHMFFLHGVDLLETMTDEEIMDMVMDDEEAKS